MNAKEQRLADWLKANNGDGVWLRRRSNIAWITDGADVHVDSGSPLGIASLWWSPSRKVVYTDNIEANRLRDEEFVSEWELRATDWWKSPDEPLADGTLTDCPDDLIAPLRCSLTADEIERVRALGAETAEVMGDALREVARGQSEHGLAGALSGRLRARGIFTPVLLVAADDRIERYRHPIPTDRRIDHLVIAAICAQRRGLIVSITRLLSFEPISAELRRRHEAVCRVDATLHRATRPGAAWGDVLAAGIRAYEEAGFGDEWQKHHQGGPMGYELRDFKVTPGERRLVQPNQLVGWNPSITGTKSEDTILSDGEVVTAMRDWPLCGDRPDILVRR